MTFPDTVQSLGAATVGPVAPPDPPEGALWIDTTDEAAPLLKAFALGQWWEFGEGVADV